MKAHKREVPRCLERTSAARRKEENLCLHEDIISSRIRALITAKKRRTAVSYSSAECCLERTNFARTKNRTAAGTSLEAAFSWEGFWRLCEMFAFLSEFFLWTNYSRRKNRRFCCADSLTTSRSAGSCGILKERCSTHEIAAMTLFSAKFGCLLRSAECRWGVPGLLRHESPFKECVAENKTRIPIRQTNCYFSDSRRRVPWLLSQHRDMLFR